MPDRYDEVAAIVGVRERADDRAAAEALLDYAKRVRHADVILGWFKRRCPLTAALGEMLGVPLGSNEQAVRRAVLRLQASDLRREVDALVAQAVNDGTIGRGQAPFWAQHAQVDIGAARLGLSQMRERSHVESLRGDARTQKERDR